MNEFLAESLHMISSQENWGFRNNKAHCTLQKWSSLWESCGFPTGLEKIGGRAIISFPQPTLGLALVTGEKVQKEKEFPSVAVILTRILNYADFHGFLFFSMLGEILEMDRKVWEGYHCLASLFQLTQSRNHRNGKPQRDQVCICGPVPSLVLVLGPLF